MRFLLDMNLPRELGRRLGSRGHEWRHAGDIGLDRAADASIVDIAAAAGAVILTHDLDYGDLLAFSGRSGPSVIIFRLRNTGVDSLFERMINSWTAIEEPLRAGAIVVVDDAALRIRGLPIARDRQT